MKLADHTDHIRVLIDRAFRNRLGRMGITSDKVTPAAVIPAEYHDDRNRIEDIFTVFVQETGTASEGYEKLVEELTFTLFNRIAALKVMEAHTLHPEIITRRSQHGNRSFAFLAWLEEHPDARDNEVDSLTDFLVDQFEALADELPLFSPKHPYHLLPTAVELNQIMEAFNTVETDTQVETDIWMSDDVLGWLYESYNNVKKKKHKDSKKKTEYDKVSIQSQWYTPRWVVKFLVDNSLGKLYLEMYPDSELRNSYKIANAPTQRQRDPKPLHEIKIIDPATGSGNFLLYAFDLFYDMYMDQIDSYGADYLEREIPKLIIERNLHGIDLDDRGIQLAQLGLFIKAKRKRRNIHIDHYNVVSSDFFLPEYDDVNTIFEFDHTMQDRAIRIIKRVWNDLRDAHKFGSLIHINEKLDQEWFGEDQKKDSDQGMLFEADDKVQFSDFREQFFKRMHDAVSNHAASEGVTFLNTKTQDAITFLQLLTQQYDVAVANPPYTDSSDFGSDLKAFVEVNYKKPYKFNTNLYAAFIKRCCEIVNAKGKVAMVHPPTFMYIKTFEDVRKFILDKMYISIFVDWGYLGMFHPAARVDSAMYILEKEPSDIPNHFIKLNDIYEGRRYDAFVSAYDDLLSNRPNKHNITLPQEKLKIIEGWPFIYWISDGFREKFKEKKLDDILFIRQGGATGDNLRTLRFWWEIDDDTLSKVYGDNKKWVAFQKGGPYRKWFGNNWCIIGYNDPIEYKYLKNNGNSLPSEDKYFLEGVTYCSSGSKGISFRYMPSNQIISGAGPGILPNSFSDINYSLGFLNSKLSFYIADCLNPTVNTTQGDLKRIPFVMPPNNLKYLVSTLTKNNVDIKQELCSYRLVETNFAKTPLITFKKVTLKDRVLAFLNFENAQHTQVLINEAIINELIFEVYELSDADREQVEAKMGKSIGSMPVMQVAKQAFLEQIVEVNQTVTEHIEKLPTSEFHDQLIHVIKDGFATLYQSNNDLEEFCIRHQVNPINVWYWFKEANIVPTAHAAEIALEFLADAIRTLLKEDPDGIIPLSGLPDEEGLSQRLERHSLEQGFTSAQYLQLDGLLGRPLNQYLEHNFFKDFSDHLNLFMYLPKTPFIWHLSSGPYQGFEVYLIIYKWNRDKLYRLKSYYLANRRENLEFRQLQLEGSNTAQAQQEKELIRNQLVEIEAFEAKIDELISEGYDPVLDSGVGKNIAPLQQKGMLRAEVLKDTQLEKYLKADW